MADVGATLRWTGDGLAFDAAADGREPIRVDGSGTATVQPMETMLLGLASCTAADIVEILAKMRVPLDALEVRAEADRAPEPPRRYTAIRLVYQTRGVPEDEKSKLRRAIQLSHDKYCSALASLRADVELTTEIDMLD